MNDILDMSEAGIRQLFEAQRAALATIGIQPREPVTERGS
jgi:hypothetical protein